MVYSFVSITCNKQISCRTNNPKEMYSKSGEKSYAKDIGSLTIKENSTFRAKALRREVTIPPDEVPLLETSNFPLSFQVVRKPITLVYHCIECTTYTGNVSWRKSYLVLF